MNYSIKKQVDFSFTDTLKRVKELLVKEGFGVLTEIDVKATLKNKIDVDWSNYIILGVCNPTLAYKALQAEKEIGLFLPCNVIVYEDSGNVFVSAIMPSVAMEMIENKSLMKIAKIAEEKLKKVIENLSIEEKIPESWKAFDLVCGMELDMQNIRNASEYNGKEYYFCSETCKDHFINDPEKYIGS